jgi:nucleoside-diphosphate-sugar epimerase
MRVFVAGATGVIGRRLVPQLVARGHQVTATTTDPGKLGSLEQLGAGVTVEPHQVNGQPGAIFRDRDNKVINTWTLDVLDGRIQTIHSVINPDKLGHVGSVADAWAVIREAHQTHRPAD